MKKTDNMPKKTVLLIFFLAFACSLEAKDGIRELVRRGNIVTNECYDGADYNLPIMKFYLEERPEKSGDYFQEQDFYDGTVETEFNSKDGGFIHSLVWFDYSKKNLAGFRVDVDKEGVFNLKK